jgi:multiple antibiotic resistance protein
VLVELKLAEFFVTVLLCAPTTAAMPSPQLSLTKLTFGAHVQRGTSMGLAERVGGVIGTFAMFAAVYLCYANLQYINEKIPPAAVKAISKMLAFFVICIGVEILWEGIQALK